MKKDDEISLRDWAMRRYETLPRSLWRRLHFGPGPAADLSALRAFSRDLDRSIVILLRRIAASRAEGAGPGDLRDLAAEAHRLRGKGIDLADAIRRLEGECAASDSRAK